jgi:hypothetical protein
MFTPEIDRNHSFQRSRSVLEKRNTIKRILEKKSVKKPVRELDPYEKIIRRRIMSIAPPTGKMSTNDLFNKGYGNLVTIVCQTCFVVVFVYFGITNTIQNNTSQFLIPVGGDSGGGKCENVPVEINNVFNMDIHGHWDSDASYEFGSILYTVMMSGVKFEGGVGAYQDLVTKFVDELKVFSPLVYNQDYAANMAFGSSYNLLNFDYGYAQFYIAGDTRVVYDQPVMVGGFINSTSVCIPENTQFVFDSARGHYTVTTTNIHSSDKHPWDPCDGMFDAENDLGALNLFLSLYFWLSHSGFIFRLRFKQKPTHCYVLD